MLVNAVIFSFNAVLNILSSLEKQIFTEQVLKLLMSPYALRDESLSWKELHINLI
jgi:hypothetical protein